MNTRTSRRRFLADSAAGIASGIFGASGLVGGGAFAQERDTGRNVAGTNWAGNLTYQCRAFHEPASVEALQHLMQANRRIKALGSRHSFSAIADTDAALVSLRRLNHVSEVDRQARTITVGAGARYGDFAVPLHESGFALHNLASLPHISVAGAMATATHGSGNENGNLATSVAGIEFVNAKGELVKLTRRDNGDAFKGAVVNLGAIGLVTRVTLNVLPAFDVRQYVYSGLSQDSLETNFDAIFNAAYSVSVFTNYRDPKYTAIWLKYRVGHRDDQAPDELFGAPQATRHLHPIVDLDAATCTPQRGEAGPWYERLPHFRMGFKPSVGAELQSEYFVPRRHAQEAIASLHALANDLADALLISEIRTVKGDDLWMSTAFGEDRVALHFTWRKDWPLVQQMLPKIERALSRFGVRPHWGKLTTMSPAELQTRCGKLAAFRQLLDKFDLNRNFANAYLDRYIYD